MAAISRVFILALSSFVLVDAMFKKGSKQLVEDQQPMSSKHEESKHEEQLSPAPKHEEQQTQALKQEAKVEGPIEAHQALTQKANFPSIPGLPNVGDIVNSVKDTVNKTVESAKEAVEGAVEGAEAAAKGYGDVAEGVVHGVEAAGLSWLSAGAGKVNWTLDVLGKDVLEVNTTASGILKTVKAKIDVAEDKAKAFVDAAMDLLGQVVPEFRKIVDQMHSVFGVVDEALGTIGQEKAAETLNEEMQPVFAAVEGWENSVKDVMSALTGYAGLNASNATEVSLMALDPKAQLSDALRVPLEGLKLAAGQLHNLANETFDAMNTFVDAGLNAAAGKVPNELMDNVSAIFDGVQAHAKEQLEPLGAVGDGIVAGLYDSAKDAGLHVERSGASRSGLLLCLLPALASLL